MQQSLIRVGGCGCGRERRVHVLGFTLIEVMAVLVIILLLAGIGIRVATYVQQKEAVSRAKSEIAAIELAIEAFRVDHGAYPTSSLVRPWATDLKDASTNTPMLLNNSLLVQQLTGGSKQYIRFKPKQLITCYDGYLTYTTIYTNILIDPYGYPYAYYCVRPPATNQVNRATFDLWSIGQDGASVITNTGTLINSRQDDITNWKR